MNFARYIYVLLIILTIKYFYSKYNDKLFINDKEKDYHLVREYLLNKNENFNKRPILWIHNTHNINARNWSSFYSRNSNDLNQPYLFLTIRSIINKCGNDFNVCLIDDNSFNKLIKNYTINLSNLPDPIRSHNRQLALLKLLDNYGGMMVPNSFLCVENLINVHYETISQNKPFVFECVNNRNIMSSYKTFGPELFISTPPQNPCIKYIINELEIRNSKDYTDEPNFEGTLGRLFNQCIYDNQMISLSPKINGTQQANDEPVLLENLFGNSPLKMDKFLGVYIPADEILKRIKYQWFARLSPQQILESDTFIGNLFLIHSQ
jgi:hypothetical protein